MFYKNTIMPSSNKFISGLYFLIGLYTLLCNFIPISLFNLFEYIFKVLNEKIFIIVNKHYTKVCAKEIDMIFNVK